MAEKPPARGGAGDPGTPVPFPDDDGESYPVKKLDICRDPKFGTSLC
jgi:hypothetical protein